MGKPFACNGGSAQATVGASVPGMSTQEMVLRRLFDQIVLIDRSQIKNHLNGCVTGELGEVGLKFIQGEGPHEVSIEFSDKLTCLIERSCGWNLADEQSRDQVERLICKILNEKIPKAKDSTDLCNLRGWGSLDGSILLQDSLVKRWDERLIDMLKKLKCVALDPGCCIVPLDAQKMVLNTREIFTQKPNDSHYFPYKKKQRLHRYLDESPKVASWTHTSYVEESQDNGMLTMPKRRSQRTISFLKIGESGIHRKRVPVGPSFQVDVPRCTNDSTKKVDVDQLSDAKWLGTRLWPVKGQMVKPDVNLSGKGRDDSCSCSSTRSSECIRQHVQMARLHLMSELGQAFFKMEFDNMGEEVSKSWSPEEQKTFDFLLRNQSVSDETTFLYPPLRSFSSKSRRNLVSYYFNVHVLRRMSLKTRSTFGKVDSDDDECNGLD